MANKPSGSGFLGGAPIVKAPGAVAAAAPKPLVRELRRLHEAGQYSRVIAIARKRLKKAQNQPNVWLLLAQSHLESGNYLPCLTALGDGARACGDYPAFRNLLIRAHYLAGEFEQIRAVFDSRPITEWHAGNLNIYAETMRYDVRPDVRERIEALARDHAVSPRERRGALAALHKIYDRRGELDRAFECLGRLGETYDAPPIALDTAAAAGALAAEPVKAPEGARASRRPVFIIGLPRSGSTILAQMLGAHRDCLGLGETNAFFDAERAVFGKRGAIDGATNDELLRLRALYFANVGKRAGKSSGRAVIDKGLGNFRSVGLICRAFPEAAIIHTFRYPMDCLFSIMQQPFFEEHGYKRDAARLARHYAQYQEMMHLWQERVPDRVMHLRHADFVAAFEAKTPELLERIGLPFDKRCLAPEKNADLVQTASAVQVRSAVNTAGVGRWRRYETHLAPLLEALGGEERVERDYAYWRSLSI